MVTKRGPLFDFNEVMARIKKAKGELIATRYVLFEVTPAYSTGGYYSQDIDEKYVRVTDGTLEEILGFVERHEPDPGKYFEARKEELFQATTVTRKWYMGGKVSLDTADRFVVE